MSVLWGDIMKLNISSIVKTSGASLDVVFNETIAALSSMVNDFTFSEPVSFNGQLVNHGNALKLDGRLSAEYITKCCRCLKDVNNSMSITIKEEFVSAENPEADVDTYTYTGNFIEIDKVLTDNILLNLPIRLVCTKGCKGLCLKCGADLNTKPCECKEETIDPQMEILKNFKI